MEAQNCDCRATEILGYIKFCPLHAAAEELLEACKEALTAIDERVINASKGQSLNSAEQVLMAIIAKVEGK